MLSAERKVISFLEEKSAALFVIVSTVLALVVRWSGRDVLSPDYLICLDKWYQIILFNGLEALRYGVGDYGVLYEFMVWILTKIPVYPPYAFKAVSVIFDYSLAVGCGMLLCDLKDGKFSWKAFSIVYSAVLFFPPVFLNSAFWAQSDSIYVSFIVWALLLLRKKHFNWAFFFLGISLSFKLQMVFILPFIVYLYVRKKEFSILHFLWLPVTLFASTIPALIVGRLWYAFISIYTNQVNEYGSMSGNIPNFWCFMGGNYANMSGPAVIMTMMILGLGLMLIIRYRTDLSDGRMFLILAAWSVLTAVEFLPNMHDRYFYLADILMLLLTVMDPRKFLKFFAVQAVSSIPLYTAVLFNNDTPHKMLAFLMIFSYVYFSYTVYDECKSHRAEPGVS